MGGTKLKRVTVYFTDDEWAAFADGADFAGLSFSNYVRSWMNLPPLKQGAPVGNFNRLLGQLNPRLKARQSVGRTTKKSGKIEPK